MSKDPKLPPHQLNGIAQLLRTTVHRSELPLPNDQQLGGRPLNWQFTPEEKHLVEQAVDRLMDLARDAGVPASVGLNRELMVMDLLCVHCNGCPLNLHQLLLGSDDDLSHDLLGIGKCLDRLTGQLMHGFRPRHRRPA